MPAHRKSGISNNNYAASDNPFFHPSSDRREQRYDFDAKLRKHAATVEPKSQRTPAATATNLSSGGIGHRFRSGKRNLTQNRPSSEYIHYSTDAESEDMIAENEMIHCSSLIHPLPPAYTRQSIRKSLRRRRQPWSDGEFRALEAGMQMYGAHWVMILNDPKYGGILAGRTNVDLKDKARNERLSRERHGLPLGVFGDACVYMS